MGLLVCAFIKRTLWPYTTFCRRVISVADEHGPYVPRHLFVILSARVEIIYCWIPRYAKSFTCQIIRIPWKKRTMILIVSGSPLFPRFLKISNRVFEQISYTNRQKILDIRRPVLWHKFCQCYIQQTLSTHILVIAGEGVKNNDKKPTPPSRALRMFEKSNGKVFPTFLCLESAEEKCCSKWEWISAADHNEVFA